MESRVVSVIVQSAKNLKAKKKGSHKFWVVFGVGDKKYSTDVSDDPAGCPCWNDRSDIKVDDEHESLIFVVKEKHSTLGKVEVPINQLPLEAYKKVTTAPLQEHKKCPNPVGTLVYEAWVTTITKNGSFAVEKKDKKSPLSKIKFKSPNLPKAIYSSLKPLRHDGNGNFLRIRLKSSSMTDLRGSTESVVESKLVMKADRSPSFALTRGIQGIANLCKSGSPVINIIEPCQGTCLGGTVLTIEGENMGTNAEDIVILEVGGSDCLKSLKYISSKKLMMTTKPHKPGGGQVTIQTYSGGKTTSNDLFQFINDVPGTNGLRKKSSLWQGDLTLKKDDKYLTMLEEELGKLRAENNELRSTNAGMFEYIQRLVGKLIVEYPEALAIPKKF